MGRRLQDLRDAVANAFGWRRGRCARCVDNDFNLAMMVMSG